MKFTSLLTAAAFIGAGVLFGNVVGDQISADDTTATTVSPQYARPLAEPPTRTTLADNGNVDDYNNIVSSSSIDASAATVAPGDESYLPYLDSAEYASATMRHMTSVTEQDPSNYPANDWYRWDTAVPGMTLEMSKSDGRASTCTLGFIGEKAGKYFGITAGHCMQGSGDPSWSKYSENRQTPFGEFLAGQNREGSLWDNAQFETDYAVTSIDSSVAGDMAIANHYKITKVLQPSEITKGMEVCKMGFRTEETCGKVMAWNDSMVRIELFSLSGDSGSPAYVKLGGKNVAAVGLLSGSPTHDGVETDSITDFALLAPVVEHTGLDITPYLR